MTPVILANASEAAHAVAGHIVTFVRSKPDAVLGLATGATMEPVYDALRRAYRHGDISFSLVTTFNLDEYVGLPADHPGSYRATMNRLLFDHVDIDPSRTHLPDGTAGDLVAAGIAYETAIGKAGGIDLQLLGIGSNGHIGFNEPGSPLNSRTRCVSLHAETLSANQRFFLDRRVPQEAITMGITSILAAKRIIVLATGAAKKDAVARALCGRFDPACPASALGAHGDVTWVLDRAASANANAA